MAQDKLIASAIARLNKLTKIESFDPSLPGSRPTSPQTEFLKDINDYQTRIIRAGNRSGKSATVAHEVASILNNSNPYFIRPLSWENTPLLILVAGQDRKMMEIELWSKKLALFLDLKEWRQQRVGGSLQYVENKKTGDKIVFLSHADSSDKNRKHMQGYTAHYVWLDEMPSSVALLQEIRARASTNGIFVGTFTPKFRSDEVRQVIDGIKEPYGKTYRFSMLDNPSFKGREKDIISELEGYSEQYKASVLYGEWYIGDNQVYEFNRETMVKEPEGYSRAWPHVESVDPALKSKFGYTMWTQEPSTGIWYLIRDEYIEGIYSPDDMVEEVIKRGTGYNIVRRVCDPHEAWYLGQASKMKLSYTSPYDKNNRKAELIKGLQIALSKGKIKIAPWCQTFINEITGCQWSESNENRIVNSSSFHALDCSQYFVDCMPKDILETASVSWVEKLRKGNAERKAKEYREKTRPKNSRTKSVTGWGPRGRQNKVFRVV